MTRRFQSVVLTLCTVAAFQSALAATPTLMNYQGILTDGSGTPQVGGPFNVTFSIYDDASATNPAVWTEPQSVTTDAMGRFNVLLGSVTALTDAAFSGPNRWLGTTVSPDLSDLLPRTQIVTDAYAYRIATVDGAAGGTILGDVAVAGGNVNLDLSSATSGNILKSGVAFIHDFGTDNTFLGANAGNMTMNGFGNNTAVGTAALRNNVTGSQNTASGRSALENNTDGYSNTANGYYALSSNTTGYNNTASGQGALYNNTTGFNNSATGYGGLAGNTTGTANTSNGVDALRNNTTGFWNTAGGRYALFANVSGQYNTALGNHSLESNTIGSENTAVGLYALRVNTTGTNNTAIGAEANVSVGNLFNATAIGYDAIVNASNKVRLGNNNVTVIEGKVAYTFTSDEDAKENFQPVDGDEVLRKLREMTLASWNYKGNDPQQFRHYGPVAQDFFEAFGHDGVGKSGTPTTINSGDQAGILMIAVQALSKRNLELESTVKDLAARLERIEGGQSSTQK